MQIHLIDGTYELFRQYFGVPAELREKEGGRLAVRGVVNSLLGMVRGGVTHMGVATDHVIESFRNDLWPSYKSSAGVPEDLLAHFPVLEEQLQAAGIAVFPMVELEADDGLASLALLAAEDERVVQVVICTPDKDLGQCVVGDRIVQLDRRKDVVLDEAGVLAKFGVLPSSIPDWLALVGDSADGFPGLKGWGKTGAAAVLRCYGHIEDIPRLGERWTCDVRGARTLANTLAMQMETALLFKELATLRIDRSLISSVDELRAPAPAGPGTPGG
jgi:5'-3' exonuclease